MGEVTKGDRTPMPVVSMSMYNCCPTVTSNGLFSGCCNVLVDVEVLLNVKFLLDVNDVLVDPVPSVVVLLEGVDVEVLPLDVEFLLE